MFRVTLISVGFCTIGSWTVLSAVPAYDIEVFGWDLLDVSRSIPAHQRRHIGSLSMIPIPFGMAYPRLPKKYLYFLLPSLFFPKGNLPSQRPSRLLYTLYLFNGILLSVKKLVKTYAFGDESSEILCSIFCFWAIKGLTKYTICAIIYLYSLWIMLTAHLSFLYATYPL